MSWAEHASARQAPEPLSTPPYNRAYVARGCQTVRLMRIFSSVSSSLSTASASLKTGPYYPPRRRWLNLLHLHHRSAMWMLLHSPRGTTRAPHRAFIRAACSSIGSPMGHREDRARKGSGRGRGSWTAGALTTPVDVG